MIREIILVEVVNKADMSTEESKAFTNAEKAENYFKKLLEESFGEYFKKLLEESFGELDEEDLEMAIDNGYYDSDDIVDGQSVIIKEISFEED